MGNPIHHLTALGADAMDNMYDVKVTIPNNSGLDFPDDIKNLIREGEDLIITGRLISFAPPAWKSGTYEIGYHGVKKKMPSTKAEMTRDLSLEFRMDSNYLWYKAWKALANHGANAQTGGVANWIPGIGDVSGDSFITPGIETNPGITLEVVALKTAYLGIDAPASKEYGMIDFDDTSNTIKWVYKQFWVSECTEPTFTTDGGAFQKFKVTGHFGECDYPASNHRGPANA